MELFQTGAGKRGVIPSQQMNGIMDCLIRRNERQLGSNKNPVPGLEVKNGSDAGVISGNKLADLETSYLKLGDLENANNNDGEGRLENSFHDGSLSEQMSLGDSYNGIGVVEGLEFPSKWTDQWRRAKMQRIVSGHPRCRWGKILPIINRRTASTANHRTAAPTNHRTVALANHRTASRTYRRTVVPTNHRTAALANHRTAALANHRTASLTNHKTAALTNHRTAVALHFLRIRKRTTIVTRNFNKNANKMSTVKARLQHRTNLRRRKMRLMKMKTMRAIVLRTTNPRTRAPDAISSSAKIICVDDASVAETANSMAANLTDVRTLEMNSWSSDGG